MTIPEFITELKALNYEWKITGMNSMRRIHKVQDPVSHYEVTCIDCPIIALAKAKNLTEKVFASNSHYVRYGIRLGLSPEDCLTIARAADFMDNYENTTNELRRTFVTEFIFTDSKQQ